MHVCVSWHGNQCVAQVEEEESTAHRRRHQMTLTWDSLQYPCIVLGF